MAGVVRSFTGFAAMMKEVNDARVLAGIHFRTAVDALLQAIAPDHPCWWYPYEVRDAYDYQGIRFRHFYCIAGSVECWLWITAKKCCSRRVIILSDEFATVFPPNVIYDEGKEVVIAADDVQAIRTGY